MLANGSSFETAVAQAKAFGMPVGVHLNLTEGMTLTGQIEGLTDHDGRLPGKWKSRQYLAVGACDHVAIRRELTAQIERFMIAGLQPDHLDSHQHCHLFPCLTEMVTELALEHGIYAMRNARPAEPLEQTPQGFLGEELNLYRRLGQEAQLTIVNSGIKTPDGLWGMPLLNHLDSISFCCFLENLPAGRWELMTHPGYPCARGQSFDGPQRQIELQALLSVEAQEIIARRRIHLSSFGELPCAF
jgi:predicted glycoside hydrolase/deacetylase ChbG (UPF0249 family)